MSVGQKGNDESWGNSGIIPEDDPQVLEELTARRRLLSRTEPEVFGISTDEFDALCQEAVRSREYVPSLEYATLMDEGGNIYKQYTDGRVEYVLL